MSRRFQFSLKVLLGSPVIVAAMLAAFLGENYIAMRVMPFLVCGVAAGMIASANRHLRVFGIAAIIPLSIGAVVAIMPFFDIPSMGYPDTVAGLAKAEFVDGPLVHYKFRIGFLWAAAIASGTTAAAISWLFSNGE